MASRPSLFLVATLPVGRIILEEVFDIVECQSWPPNRDEVLQKIAGVDAAIVYSNFRVDKQFLDKAGSKLKVISTKSAGLEHIDITECRRRGISVGFTPGPTTDSTAELAVTLLLTTSRRIKEGFRAVSDAKFGWENSLWNCGKQINGCTVGIVGLGKIGMAVAKRLQPFGVSSVIYSGHEAKPWACDIGAQFVSFDDLLKQSDFVIACCSINDKNKRLFNKKAFSKMKSDAIFINVSRGVLVNQEDLYVALTTGQIMAAGLDVTSPEPLPVDHPLHSLDNCTIFPHLGTATIQSKNKMAILAIENAIAGVKGQTLPSPVPLHCVR